VTFDVFAEQVKLAYINGTTKGGRTMGGGFGGQNRWAFAVFLILVLLVFSDGFNW